MRAAFGMVCAFLAGCMGGQLALHAPTTSERSAQILDNTIDAPPLMMVYLDAQEKTSEPTLAESAALGDIAYPSRAPGLWGDLVDGFTLFQAHQHRPLVQTYIERIRTNKRFFDHDTVRAAPYLHYVYTKVREAGLPMEMALLPLVESRYDPRAVSNQKAAGMWQFTPSTGRYYGLRQNWWYDGRLDVVASTEAAIEMLKALHDYYDDWLLALAAYNYGRGNVNRAIKKAKAAGKTGDYWSIELPRETRHYVPKLMAYSVIFAHFGEFSDLPLHPVENAPVVQKMWIDRPLSLAALAEAAGMSAKAFKRLNPGFRQSVVEPNYRHAVLMPVAKVPVFERHVATLPLGTRDWQSYKVKSGDTLYTIGRLFGLNWRDLKQLNQLNKTVIYPGQRLLVPKPA